MSKKYRYIKKEKLMEMLEEVKSGHKCVGLPKKMSIEAQMLEIKQQLALREYSGNGSNMMVTWTDSQYKVFNEGDSMQINLSDMECDVIDIGKKSYFRFYVPGCWIWDVVGKYELLTREIIIGGCIYHGDSSDSSEYM
jgi:hypothetical protein